MIHSERLAYCYPGGHALVFPDVRVPQGGVLLLSGPSGSGKSTWLALVAALVAPAAGALQVAGHDVTALRGAAADAWRARTIGFLPQRLHLSAALTVQHNLAMAQWAAGRPRDFARIHSALAALGVAELAGRLPSQLSGGQAQRVALARALLCSPQVLLADEPTASLDDQAAAQAVGLLLATAAQHGATLVIATHDARVARLVPAHADGGPGFARLALRRDSMAGA
ncbi:MAG: ATP-binding cassette domain-containing protein [Rhodoferax sp.]|nr:ATP-binding cassette domain-containing protein [Rhodoferax sp.]